MYTLVLVAILTSNNPDAPIQLLTRPSVGYYVNEEFCRADGANQLKKFVAELPSDPKLLAAKCVKITGPEGNPA